MMTERERLYELIVDADNEFFRESPYGTAQERIEKTVEHLLANGVILPPCKVGDTVYEIYNDTDACNDCTYYSGFYGDSLCDKEDGDIKICPEISDEPLCDKQHLMIQPYIVKDLYQVISIMYSFGKTVFFTRADAEEALERRIEMKYKQSV